LFDASGDLGAESVKFLQGWMDRYVAWVVQHAVHATGTLHKPAQ